MKKAFITCTKLSKKYSGRGGLPPTNQRPNCKLLAGFAKIQSITQI